MTITVASMQRVRDLISYTACALWVVGVLVAVFITQPAGWVLLGLCVAFQVTAAGITVATYRRRKREYAAQQQTEDGAR